MQDRPKDQSIDERFRSSPNDGPAATGARTHGLPSFARAAAGLSLRRIVLAGLLLAAAGFAVKTGLHYVMHGRFQIETDDAYVEADTTLVAPEVTGTVAEVAVTENAPVAVGDVLVRLVDSDAKARLAQADSAVATARATLANTEARLKHQDAMIRSAVASAASAQSDVTRTKADHDRYTLLMTNRITTPQRYEAARSEAEKARAGLDRANAGIEAERQQLVVLRTQIDQGRAQIQQAEAQLELARIDVSRTVIRAPVAGVVGNRGVQVGQYVRPGTQMMAIVPMALVRVVANFKETQIAGLARGQAVLIHADAWPDVRVQGRVESLAPASGSRFSILPPENATGNFTKIVQRVPVRIVLDPAHALTGRLRPGLSVIVTVDSRSKGDGAPGDLRAPVAAPVAASGASPIGSASGGKTDRP